MYLLYNLLLIIATVLILPAFCLYVLITGKYREGLGQRLGFISSQVPNDPSLKPRLWIHACSVGEVIVISPIITEIKRIYPSSYIVVSNTTRSGHGFAKKALKNVSSYIFFPLDLGWVVRRALKAVSPDIFIVSETEIWPNFLRTAKRRGIKTIMVNGRISVRSFGSYMKVKYFMKRVLQNFNMMSMIMKSDADRIISMGASPERVLINGNSKYDRLADQVHQGFEEEIRGMLRISREDKVFIAGSTRTGEEEVVIEAYLRFIEVHPDMLMIIAPRHIERTSEIEELLRKNSLGFVLKTDLDKGKTKRDKQVIVVDTIGDLFKVYSVGTIVFCGGSLVPLGGQNVLEAAAWGKVVFYGPSMEDFLDARELLERVGAGIEVKDADDLAKTGIKLLKDPETLRSLGEAGREAVMANRGSAGRNAELIKELLEGKI
ncbi:MAG: 3-deoxy-D-manno-octulosonic acid transferase [Desulfobacterales bacterium]|nr:3-deoxy-D-manno-octulosonic acid transferase [Desulfobacterales bacterium]